MSAPEPRVDVEQVMREIRERVYRRTSAAPPGAPDRSSLREIDWTSLRHAAQHAARCAGLVGQMPSAPLTWRARCGGVFVRLVRRMLFWYTPQIAQYQQASARAIREQVEAMERLDETVRVTAASIHARLDELERERRGRSE